MSGFPRPEEVRSEFEKSLQPVVEVIKREVRKLFTTPSNMDGGWSFDPSSALALEISPFPSYEVIKAAFDLVKVELIASGWDAEWRTYRGEFAINIKPLS